MLDLIFCLPVIFGCSPKIKPEGDQTPRICPRCNNASVIRATSQMWFELFFVKVIPMSKKHIWMCGICQWNIPVQTNWEPPVAGSQPMHYQQAFLQGPPPNLPGYQPAYPSSPGQAPPAPK